MAHVGEHLFMCLAAIFEEVSVRIFSCLNRIVFLPLRLESLRVTGTNPSPGVCCAAFSPSLWRGPVFP